MTKEERTNVFRKMMEIKAAIQALSPNDPHYYTKRGHYLNKLKSLRRIMLRYIAKVKKEKTK